MSEEYGRLMVATVLVGVASSASGQVEAVDRRLSASPAVGRVSLTSASGWEHGNREEAPFK